MQTHDLKFLFFVDGHDFLKQRLIGVYIFSFNPSSKLHYCFELNVSMNEAGILIVKA
jgi:hypothetical protein